MLLNPHVSAYARCLAGKVCGLVQSTRGTSQGDGQLGARDKILNTKVARRARAGRTFPHCPPLNRRSRCPCAAPSRGPFPLKRLPPPPPLRPSPHPPQERPPPRPRSDVPQFSWKLSKPKHEGTREMAYLNPREYQTKEKRRHYDAPRQFYNYSGR